ncbi:hypothetical protein [Chitinophaga barathri]|uniref:Gliding motility lipoprotein GldB n=1 Tax=Chitinophaga barathri TaxID=1647451 RepID=A0A3N4M8R2_9BACT|nr:hypothetical protein [Chitinophaga barathri]RPD40034.1 hypothetical protein EG028_15350 [Chitinophaga barathri]
MQNYKNKYFLAALFLTGWIISGCGGRKNIPDVSHIPIDVKIQRFDEEFFHIDTNNVPERLKLLGQAYPHFAPVYFSQILSFGPSTDSPQLLSPQVRSFLTNKDFRALQDSVEIHFKDIKPVEAALTQAFRLTKYYLPKFQAPQVVSFISAIGNFGAVVMDSTVGIGLDMHMGADFPVYRLIPDYPDYVVRKFTPEYIPVNVMKVVQEDLYPPQGEGAQLVVKLIDLGRQQYFLEKVLPGTPEEIRLGYTKEQLVFCDENEEMVWQYFVQNKLLYTSDWQDIMRYTGESPSTQGLPAGAPGQIGAYVGYRIVQAYMKKNPDITLEQLLATKDPMTIFSKAKYRP